MRRNPDHCRLSGEDFKNLNYEAKECGENAKGGRCDSPVFPSDYAMLLMNFRKECEQKIQEHPSRQPEIQQLWYDYVMSLKPPAQ